MKTKTKYCCMKGILGFLADDLSPDEVAQSLVGLPGRILGGSEGENLSARLFWVPERENLTERL